MPRAIILSNPRSGSTFLQQLLKCHPEVEFLGELLNDELTENCLNPLEQLKNALDIRQTDGDSPLKKALTGFKAFPEQIFGCGLTLSEIVEAIGASYVIVLWRESILETLVSRRIADLDGEWYSTEERKSAKSVKIEIEDLKKYVNHITQEWEQIGLNWPLNVCPVFVKFEDLIKNPAKEVKRILSELSISSENLRFFSQSVRQNPASVEEKVLNFQEIPANLRDRTLDVKSILENKNKLEVPAEILKFVPHREPLVPSEGWRYRVAEPYLPANAKQNAFDAIQSGSISSAGYWPKRLSSSLRILFECPVAQPCSSGFTALFLALQCAGIKEGDEVILPTMTMVAVPNAVHFLKGTPIFVDNSRKDSYNPSWKEYEAKSSSRTKAVIVTHTYGVPVEDIAKIAENCKNRGWILIEDISECVGITCDSSGRLLGTFGDFAVASLYANKIIHGGDGGFVLAKNAKVGRRLQSLVNHGFTPSFHFLHFEPALNAKIHGIGAAIATGCLSELETIMKHRSLLGKWYRSGLEGLQGLKLMPQCGPKDTPWVFAIQCKSKAQRTELRRFLASYGIETRDFFLSLHLQPAFLPQGDNKLESLPNAENLGSTGLYLPTHTNLTENDVIFICSCVKSFFNPELTSKIKLPSKSPSKMSVQVEPNGFALQVCSYKETGELKRIFPRSHFYIKAVALGVQAEEILFNERFDRVESLIKSLKDCLSSAEGDPLQEEMTLFFKPYLEYFESQEINEQVERPWLQIDLSEFKHSKRIPTTTDPETLQFLVWILLKERPKTIWEIGSWLGHATTLISEACPNIKVFACDAFLWQPWMQNYLQGTPQLNGKNFLEVFKKNVEPFGNQVEPVLWPYDILKLPEALKEQKAELIYLDITQEDTHLEQIWDLIKPNLIPGKTIILFNGLIRSSIPFFTRHSAELRALPWKPYTMAKAFKFLNSQETLDAGKSLKRVFKFYKNPNWEHHNRNLFSKGISSLRKEFHSEKADLVFIPAVEETLCDDPDVFFEHPWIGIIHSVEEYPELFYTPDLKRLCTSPRHIAALQNCKGLFALTHFQADYLRRNLPKSLFIPIQRISYAMESVDFEGSNVPDKLNRKEVIDLIHVGGFARDFQFFFNVRVPKMFQKVLVTGDEVSKGASQNVTKDVIVLGRLSEEEYEEKLKNSVVFLTLKYEGAANTLIMECISRNVPILAPNFSSCTDYLGREYPLLYDPSNPELINEFLTPGKILEGISYLESMDKSKFSLERLIDDIKNGPVLQSLPPLAPKTYDVTISICSWKRTHNLARILESLWSSQDFDGTFQIIIWNNNEARSGTVRDLVAKYLQSPTEKKSLEVINSTENYYCSVRLALAPLIKSERVLICDDDVIPGSNFISFFYKAHLSHPEDVLCLRGHAFLEHELGSEGSAAKFWEKYEFLRFRDDNQPEQFIHFVHADACLIPKKALMEAASVSMPDPGFNLVDDYWMSFVLSYKFGRKLRKLCVGEDSKVIERTEDSDTPGLALHTRPEVQDARVRLYIHHMLQDWPEWKGKKIPQIISEEIKQKKEGFWRETPSQIGFNIHSAIDKDGVDALVKMGVKLVRIGAVGVGGKHFFELSGFLNHPSEQLERLGRAVELLAQAEINVILTLDRRLATGETWKVIAEKFASFGNVIGYDLINEPFTEAERDLHWKDIENQKKGDTDELKCRLINLIKAVREVDNFTSIILEPTFWGRIYALEKFPVEDFLQIDSNLVMSFHFYEPMFLTSRVRNKGRYSFPGWFAWYENPKATEDRTFWNPEEISKCILQAKYWAAGKRVPIFLGEFGISRDIKGAKEYLKAVMDSCKEFSITGLLFSFRDPDWEAMDYEFGEKSDSFQRDLSNGNQLLKIISEGVAKMRF